MLFEYVVESDQGSTYFKTANEILAGDTLAAYLNNTLLSYYTVDTVNTDGNIATLTPITSAPAGPISTAVILS
jgi:hypothetical protein